MVTVVGGGLAGCEAAWQLAERGHEVTLVEMRPVRTTPAHQTEGLAELVCTNSFKSEDPTNAHGLLKREMRTLGSILLDAADLTRVPAGAALAVDRDLFSARMGERIEAHPRIRLERREVTTLPDGPAIVASGPLTSGALTEEFQRLLGDAGLAFYDSIAPIVSLESIDLDTAYFLSRWGKGNGDDYLNCPLDREQYYAFIAALREAEIYPGHEWEGIVIDGEDAPPATTQGTTPAEPAIPYFEGCLPVEVLASRGDDTLRFGPRKPVGLRDPRTRRNPYAEVQIRREDRGGQMWNLVGFQTRLRTGAQRRVFRLIPGLEQAEFLRYGSIHRNSYLIDPAGLTPVGAPAGRAFVIFAGQLTGVEGYTESAASGILAGVNLDRLLRGQEPVLPPSTTMLGGLYRYLNDADPAAFAPMNSNFGLIDPLETRSRDKQTRRAELAARAEAAFEEWLAEHGIESVAVAGAPV
jgi:methylenetetrahydrofolate--tRNA-(uracil-5-)-methyltransferase